MDKKEYGLLHHLIKTTSSEEVWRDLFKVLPPSKKVWLEGERPAILELATSLNITSYVVDEITEKLGAEVWTQPVGSRTPLAELFMLIPRVQHLSHSDVIQKAVANVLAKVSPDDVETHLKATLMREELNKGLNSINIQSWCGRPREYWTGHELEIPASLIALNLPEAALALAGTEAEKTLPDGTNLAYLFMHSEKAWNAWVSAGKSTDAPIYVDQEGQTQDTSVPMYEWMAQKGNLFKGVAKRGKAEGKDVAFEEQLRGKAWRSALNRRESWREWTGSSGKNALHIIARHHPASFLTSQARVEANRPLMGQLDRNGDDCINHLIMGMLDKFPEHRRSYWTNALARFGETIRVIEQESEKNHNKGKARGLMAALVHTDKFSSPIDSSWNKMFEAGVMGWIRNNPEKMWARLDHSCAMVMIQKFSRLRESANFITNIVGREVGDGASEYLLNTAPEARMILLTMLLSNPNHGSLAGYKGRVEKLRSLFNETMNEEMTLSEPALETLKNIVDIYMDQTTTARVNNEHLRMISKKLLSVKLNRLLPERIPDNETDTRLKM